ncbi:MAG: FtsX-like permease family protein [Bacteroidota bacterium]|nr:FtsX-like permease family protein [Bacteroidota bacterium]
MNLFDRWLWIMAWRESRGSRHRLVLFLSSMTVGVALLTTLTSTGDSLEKTVHDEARQLLGADLRIASSRPFTEDQQKVIRQLGGDQANRVSFLSMALFPEQERTRMVMVRVIERGYPLYGSVETDPPEAADSYLDDQQALVDHGLMSGMGLAAEDSIQIGRNRLAIAGAIRRAPREIPIGMIVMPPVYIPAGALDSTLLARGSMAEHDVYVRLHGRTNQEIAELKDSLEATLDLDVDTAEEEQEAWREVLKFFHRFLGLSGFAALVLGGLGVGGAIRAHIDRCLTNIAVLRCLGASSGRTLGVYFVQALILGSLAGLLGCLLGMMIQLGLPRVLEVFLPFSVRFIVSWDGLAIGFGIGLVVTLLFALMPLRDVQRVSPLRALRFVVEPLPRTRFQYVVFVIIALGLAAVAYMQSGSWQTGLAYTAALIVVFGVLTLLAKVLMSAAKRLTRRIRLYSLRQGVANLHRPGNQTTLMMLALGLATFIVMVMLIGEHMVVQRIDTFTGEDRPDMILFDIQADQLSGVHDILEAEALPMIESTPMVNMRIHARGDSTVAAMQHDSVRSNLWAYTREYRNTYRAAITDAEEIVEGEFTGSYRGSGPIPISIEEDFARNALDVALGDTLVFDVQGVQIPTVIGSLRRVDWEQVRANFYVVFPAGVLEEAPQTYIVSTREGTFNRYEQIQAAVVAAYPNVTVLSLDLLLKVFDEVVGRIRSVISFMAYFCLVAGLIVLMAAVMISRSGRIREQALLKTLGAARHQVAAITVFEYTVLGLLSSIVGLVLALAGCWLLARFVFDLAYVVAPVPIILVVSMVVLFTVAVGQLSTWHHYARPTLAVLRTEV